MSTRPFRFLIASDFHLEQPLGGVAEVPDHLRDLFLDSPYTASRRVFDAALAEDADFVLCAGDILPRRTPGHAGRSFSWNNLPDLRSAGSPFTGQAARSIRPTPGPKVWSYPKTFMCFPRVGSKR